MIDQFGREINYLRLSVTERCTLRCDYCRVDEGICPKRKNLPQRNSSALRTPAPLGYHQGARDWR